MKSRRYSKRRYQKKTMRKKYLRKKTMRRKNLRRRKTMRRKKTRNKKRLLVGGSSYQGELIKQTREAAERRENELRNEVNSRVPKSSKDDVIADKFDGEKGVQELLQSDGNDSIVRARTGALDSLSGIGKKGCDSQDVIEAKQLVTLAKEKLETEKKNLKETKQKNGCKTKKSFFRSIFKRKSKQARADPIYED